MSYINYSLVFYERDLSVPLINFPFFSLLPNILQCVLVFSLLWQRKKVLCNKTQTKGSLLFELNARYWSALRSVYGIVRSLKKKLKGKTRKGMLKACIIILPMHHCPVWLCQPVKHSSDLILFIRPSYIPNLPLHTRIVFVKVLKKNKTCFPFIFLQYLCDLWMFT